MEKFTAKYQLTLPSLHFVTSFLTYPHSRTVHPTWLNASKERRILTYCSTLIRRQQSIPRRSGGTEAET